MLIYPEILIAASLGAAAIEDYKTRQVHYLTWFPFAVGAGWILLADPPEVFTLFILVFPIFLLVKARLLGGAEMFGFGAIALLGAPWSIITALLAFCFLALIHLVFLGAKRKDIMKYHVAWIPYLAFGFAVALVL